MSTDITQDEAIEGEVQDEFTEAPAVEEPVAPELDLTEFFDDEPAQEPVYEEPQEPQEAYPQEYYEPTLADQVRQLGFSDVADDGEAQNRLLESYQQLANQNQQWANYSQQLQGQYDQQLQEQQQYADYGREYLQQQQAQQQEQTPEPGEQHWWAPPEFDLHNLDQYREQVFNQETGTAQWDWRDGTPLKVKTAAEGYSTYLEDWAEKLLRRPQEVLPEIIKQEFDKYFPEAYSKVVDYTSNYYQGMQQQAAVEDINARNADWVYQRDPRTQQFVQDVNGSPVLSSEGAAVTNYVNYFRQQGISDPSTLWDLATRMYAGDLSTSMLSQQQQQVQQTYAAQQRNMQHLQSQSPASHIPSAAGSVPAAYEPEAPSQNPHLTAGEKLRQQAIADGLF
ncbi:hypothetical protein [uncultured Marinobacter sp.]|uniref:hypothetical protein n=1 Tax=uncultured Marinobacter sp. TaxID=187379 RepID=UPI0030DD1B30